MLVKCTFCEAKIKIADSALERGIPTVICPICKHHFKPVLPKDIKIAYTHPVRNEETKPLLSQTKEVGWLVVHDEKTPQQTLSLKLGEQIIGRISAFDNKKSDLMIETEDEYMSRQHFVIKVEQIALGGGYNYYLSDNSSKSGTLINTKKLKKGDEYILKDGDIIQAGLTNIVFKTNKQVKNKREATQIVSDQPKAKTLLVYD